MSDIGETGFAVDYIKVKKMRKGATEMRLSSFSILSEAKSSPFTDKASSQTDMERMENPFRNLHPKIYYRQKNVPSRKLILDNKKELRMDFKTSPLLRVNMKTDHSTKHSNSSWPFKADDYSVISEKTAREKGCEDFEESRQNNKTIAYLNERNISLSKDASEEQKLALPLLVFPRAERENENLLNTNFHPSGKSDKGLSFPPIKEVPSFIPLVREEEKKKRKTLHKKFRDTQTTRISEQYDDEYWWNTYTAANPSRLSAREDLADQTIQPKYSGEHKILLESDMGKKMGGYQGVSKAAKFSRANNEDFNSRNHVTTQGSSARTYSNHDDLMILKAKIHRSSVL